MTGARNWEVRYRVNRLVPDEVVEKFSGDDVTSAGVGLFRERFNEVKLFVGLNYVKLVNPAGVTVEIYRPEPGAPSWV